MSGRLVASTTLTDGSPATRTPARPASRRLDAAPENARSAARLSTTLCSSRAAGSSRSTDAVRAATTDASSQDAISGSTESSATGTPAIASAATSGASWERSRLPVTPRDGRRDRTRLSVGRSDRRVSRATAAPSTSASKPIGLNTRSSNDSMPKRTPLVTGARPVTGWTGSGSGACRQHHVRRNGALLDRHVWPGAVIDDQTTGGGGAGHTDSRPSSATTLATRTGCVEPGHDQVAVADRLGAEGLHRRPLRAGNEPGRRRERGHPDGDGRRTHGVRQHGRPQVGAVGDDDQHALVAPGHRARREIHRAVDRPARPRSRARPARRPGRGTRVRAPGARQTSRRSHDGSRWTSGRSARGSQVLVTKSMTWTPGGASTRTSPGTSSPRPSAMAV